MNCEKTKSGLTKINVQNIEKFNQSINDNSKSNINHHQINQWINGSNQKQHL